MHTRVFPNCPYKFVIDSDRTLALPGSSGAQFCTVSNVRTGQVVGNFVYHQSFNLESIVKPFFLAGDWYMTYATARTKLSVAKLTDRIEHIDSDVGGENGFCPVEVVIPYIISYEDSAGAQRMYSWGFPYVKGTVEYAPFGFVSGVVHGDEPPNKLRYLDLSKLVSERKIDVYAPFNHFELPSSCGTLFDHIDLDHLHEGKLYLNRREAFSLRTDGTWRDESTRSEQQPRAKLLHSIAAKHNMLRWLYTPHAELNGMTPDSATCTFEGTVKAVELLYKERT